MTVPCKLFFAHTKGSSDEEVEVSLESIDVVEATPIGLLRVIADLEAGHRHDSHFSWVPSLKEQLREVIGVREEGLEPDAEKTTQTDAS